jgi:hypothetical protein
MQFGLIVGFDAGDQGSYLLRVSFPIILIPVFEFDLISIRRKLV